LSSSSRAGYFGWLYSLTGLAPTRSAAGSFTKLLRTLHETPFVVLVHNDENREADGKVLRQEYAELNGASDDIFRLDEPGSVLEVLLGLARRLDFQAGGGPQFWFWQLLLNLEIDRYSNDIWSRAVEQEVVGTLHVFVHRHYNDDGVGGLFPLRRARQDQRRVELWYQMSAYLIEND
jgi:hypothetical protein